MQYYEKEIITQLPEKSNTFEELDKNTFNKNNLSINRKKHIVNGVSSLHNIGNSCYLNSVIQPISHTSILRNEIFNDTFIKSIFDNIQGKSDSMETYDQLLNKFNNTISVQLHLILKKMWKENCIIRISSLKEIIGKINKEFIGSNQNDSQEVLNLLLDQIHEESKKPFIIDINKVPTEYHSNLKNEDIEKYKLESIGNYLALKYVIFIRDEMKRSIISEHITGIYYTEIICSICKNSSDRFESFINLQLDIPEEKTSLDNCMKIHTKYELLTGDNSYYCGKCKEHVDAKKKVCIWNTPRILIIQLKRFKSEMKKYNNYVSFDIKKIDSQVTIPINDFDISDSLSDYHIENCKYKLYAITLHIGVSNGGHYIAYCKNPNNSKWYKYDDSDIYYIEDDKLITESIEKNAYILYYEKI
jgi:ubiquitin carboxyl-terminal hydrolase 8